MSLFAKRWVTLYSGADVERYSNLQSVLAANKIKCRAKYWDSPKSYLKDGRYDLVSDGIIMAERTNPTPDGYVVEVRRSDAERVRNALK